MERSYFLFSNSQQTGPFTLSQARQQPVTRATMVWYEGLSGWVGIEHVEELQDLVMSGAVPPSTASAMTGAPPADGGAATASPVPPSGASGWSPSGGSNSPVPGYPSDAVLATELDKHHRLFITYLCLAIGALVLTVVVVAATAAANAEGAAIFLGVLLGAATLAMLVLQIVHFCKFHYRCWEVAIARTGFSEYPPGQAVGLLFVPLFNLYWYFKSYHQLAQVLGQATMRAPYDRSFAPNASTALTYCILNLVSIVPWLGALAGIVALVLWFVMLGENKRACKHLLLTPAY